MGRDLREAERGIALPTDLGSLDRFPVLYAAGFRSRPPARAEDRVVTWDDGSVIVWFGNSFENDRGEVTHGAIDIMAPFGSPVVVTSRQRVLDYWWYGHAVRGVTTTDAAPGTPGHSEDGGNSVRTIDDRGFIHYYAHLRDAPEVRPGHLLQPGHRIGVVGDTGAARGKAHLHYQVKTPRVLRPRLDERYGAAPTAADPLLVLHYDGFGGRPVNPYAELVRLASRFAPAAVRRGPHSTQYKLAPGAAWS